MEKFEKFNHRRQQKKRTGNEQNAIANGILKIQKANGSNKMASSEPVMVETEQIDVEQEDSGNNSTGQSIVGQSVQNQVSQTTMSL